MSANTDYDKRRCAGHPELEGRYYCNKYGRYLCDACATCADPKLYCKYRSQCIIWELERYDRLS
jgi:hypothetical protein